MPQALLASGARIGSREMCDVALDSLSWLVALQRGSDGSFAPVGSRGFYVRGGTLARFDQQPVDACATISACLEAARFSGDPAWVRHAQRAFDWFLGQNMLRQPLYDARTGGCRDGLHEDRVNENQGAESTVAYLLGLLEMRAHRAATCLVAPKASERIIRTGENLES